MVRLYRLANPGVTSITVDGVQHDVNPEGHLEVHQVTPGLEAEIFGHHAGEYIDPNAGPAERVPTPLTEAQEKEELFTKLDAAFGRKIDRRRSVQQLREMWAQREREEQAKTGPRPGAPTTPALPAPGGAG